MKAVNYSELRQNLKENLDTVSDNGEFLIVQRPKGKSVVMMSLAEYNALQETLYLSKSKANRERLESAIDNINAKTNLLKRNLAE
ncbi:MAG TPA: type II toxin-antitoxin system prevent-host-death family antitoxin [Prolixibacteraceae bacterium]|jgi:antitoxin YefM|nr:type II toxin-antitoxin system prevent-host-death family antitoxin [Prolixibacteraceae bacterium]HOY51150.1 type II toxin-antitoxin system prevent-host-death family antitoxin [Prolixibacteraceae bacterium]HPJ77589.1 type II toxin-antitoxin system prevent-host-death family antitoxin [Prolixibacteraceae bacterium]